MSGESTPGPWVYEPHSAYKTTLLGQERPLGYISRNQPGKIIFALHAVLEYRAAELLANALLIAASPELLAMAYQYRSDLLYPPTPDSRERRIAAIDALVAKATAE